MERVKFIDTAKGIGIILMVLCHTGFTNARSIQIIYAFHMPLFFIISGYLTYGRDKHKPLKQFCRKKLYQLIVPFLLFAIILCFYENGIKGWVYILYGSRNALSIANTFTPLWFLPCFFVSAMLYNIIERIGNRIVSTIIVIATGMVGFILPRTIMQGITLGLPLSIDVAMVGVLLMLIGGVMAKYNVVNKVSAKPVGGGYFKYSGIGGFF